MTSRSMQRHVALLIRTTHSTRCGRPTTQLRFSRWQSDGPRSPFGARPPKLADLEITPDCYVDKPSFPSPSFDNKAQPPNPEHDVNLNTTRPAPLNPPEGIDRTKYPNESVPVGDRARYLFRLGRSYLGFYKTGMKNIWLNYKQYRSIKEKIAPHSLNDVAKFAAQSRNGSQLPSISRAEYQLSLRTRHDLLKLIPFTLVFCVFGEFTPLVIIALGSVVVPYTCRIPQQEQKDQLKAAKRDENYMADIAANNDPASQPKWQREWREAYRYGLTVFRQPFPVFGSIYYQIFVHPKLVTHCDNILSDTILIQREGGVSKLSARDIYEWADKYDLFALRHFVQEHQKDGKELDMDRLKDEILPHVEAEVDFILDDDWERLKPSEHWRKIFRSTGSKSPDWLDRMKSLPTNKEKT